MLTGDDPTPQSMTFATNFDFQTPQLIRQNLQGDTWNNGPIKNDQEVNDCKSAITAYFDLLHTLVNRLKSEAAKIAKEYEALEDKEGARAKQIEARINEIDNEVKRLEAEKKEY